MFPHKEFEEEKFIEKAALLKKRFTTTHENALLKVGASNVPIDAVSVFLDQTW